ncbi:MAG: DUF4298 domain-containing protein [Clostridia bacterium]|nr:DUF4298 domain-containing protein [Clostridia bacterium]
MNQIKRIEIMEEKYIKSQKAIKELNKALKEYSKAQDSIRELASYYSSPEWKKDFLDDEKGRLPKELKRGVLSEDGVYNLLDDNIEMQKKLCRTVEKSIS